MVINKASKQSGDFRLGCPHGELQRVIFPSMGSSDYFPEPSAEAVAALTRAAEEETVTLPYSIRAQKLGVRTELVNSVLDLTHPPAFEQQFNGLLEVTIGDLHGNPLGLLHYLVKCGIFKFESTSSDDYQKTLSIVVRSSQKESGFGKEDLIEFERLLPRLFPVQKKDVFVRLLGDIFADRISNDILMLYVLKYLDRMGVSYEILFSNHDSFTVSYFYFEIDQAQSYIYDSTKELLEDPSYGSLSRLRQLFDSNVLKRDDFKQLLSEVYLPKLKLISYYKKADGSECVFSHAILLNMFLIRFCDVYNQEMSEIGASVSGTESLEDLIHKINSTFSYMLNNTNRKLLDDFLDIPNRDLKKEEMSCQSCSPVYMCIWNRANFQSDGSFQFDLEKAQDLRLPLADEVERIHGHTRDRVVNAGKRQYISLDQDAGKWIKQFRSQPDSYSISKLYCAFHSKKVDFVQTQKTDDAAPFWPCTIS